MSATPCPSREGFARWLQASAARSARVLDRVLPEAQQTPARLHAAMRYATLGAGKRVRAALVYAAAHACLDAAADEAPEAELTRAREAALDQAAAAVELIHAYSLVHDDLPCMDNDSLRRGQPTVHVRYDEATALLVGDALQPLAFGCLAAMPLAAPQVVAALQTLAQAAGSTGMAGGQAIDLASVGQSLTMDALQTMHRMKTGAMLLASVDLGAIVAAASDSTRQCLAHYAQAIGLAFQVVDDVLDASVDTARLGKTAGKDAADGKPTYVSLLGLTAARALADDLRAEAHAALEPLGARAVWLAGLADFIVMRQR